MEILQKHCFPHLSFVEVLNGSEFEFYFQTDFWNPTEVAS